MRLWDFSLIKFLPRQQLLAQWRECVCIAKSIYEKGSPNHILVNKIMDYPIDIFNDYCNIVLVEMLKRGYKISTSSINKLENYIDFNVNSDKQHSQPFSNWHNLRYLNQCMFNLQEKYDCNGMTNQEWQILLNGYKKITGKDFNE